MVPFTLILPAFNEERGIGLVIDAIRAAEPEAAIVVVDDGSTDGTATVAHSRGAVVIHHPANAGYGRSLKDGILAAQTDVVVIADADGSYPADRIGELLGLLERGFDMAVGARQGSHYRGSMLKMPARFVFKFLVEFTTGRRIPDINSGLRAFRRSDVLPLLPDLCEGFSFTTTITLIYLLTGKFVAYVPIAYHRRVGRSKVRILRDSLRTLQYITEVIATYNPLKLFLLLSIVPLVSAALSIALAVRWPPLKGPLTLLTFAILGSCVLFGMGLQLHATRRRAALQAPRS